MNLLRGDGLHKRINSYFKDNSKDLSDDVVDIIYKSILYNIDCDVDKLCDSFDYFIEDKRIGYDSSFNKHENVFNVSGTTNDWYVKGFMSRGFPVLYFFRDDERKPYFKIKTERSSKSYNIKIEYATNPELVGKKEDIERVNGSCYQKTINIVTTDRGSIINESMSAKTNTHKDYFIDIEDVCDEHKNFLLFLKDSLSKNGYDVLNGITPLKYDFLISEFYQKLKNITNYENEIPITDVVLLMNSVFGKGRKMNNRETADITITKSNYDSVVDSILSDSENDKTDVKEVFVETSNGNVNKIKVINRNQYMHVDITDAKTNQQVANYMFCGASDGFTFFRDLKGRHDDKKTSKMFTLNLTDNIFKLSVKNSENNMFSDSEDLTVKFTADDEVVLSSNSCADKMFTNQSQQLNLIQKQA